MLPRKNRLNLRQHPDFFNQASRYYAHLFTVFYRFSDQLNEAEQVEENLDKNLDKNLVAAVVVPKKAVKLATKRNRLRRVLSGALLELINSDSFTDLKKLKTNKLEMAVVGKKELEQADYAQILTELQQFFDKIIKS